MERSFNGSYFFTLTCYGSVVTLTDTLRMYVDFELTIALQTTAKSKVCGHGRRIQCNGKGA